MSIETYLDKSRTDLVIAELNKVTEKDIDKLRSTLSEGYFILFNSIMITILKILKNTSKVIF